MTPFLHALADTLLPADEARACPGGGEVAAVVAALAAHAEPLDRVEALCGPGFAQATDAVRRDRLLDVESKAPDAVRALATAALHAWCADARVLESFGWRAEPPQPGGHAMPETDQQTWNRLARVRARGAIWRGGRA